MVYVQSAAFVFSQTKRRLPIKSCFPECFGSPAAQDECFHDFPTPEALFQLILEAVLPAVLALLLHPCVLLQGFCCCSHNKYSTVKSSLHHCISHCSHNSLGAGWPSCCPRWVGCGLLVTRYQRGVKLLLHFFRGGRCAARLLAKKCHFLTLIYFKQHSQYCLHVNLFFLFSDLFSSYYTNLLII